MNHSTSTTRDRRRHHRLRVQQDVRIHESGHGTEWFTGSVADCSEFGLSLLSPRPVRQDADLLIEWRGGYLVGRVCNCQSLEASWRLGVRFEHVSAGKILAKQLVHSAPAAQSIRLFASNQV